MSDSRFVKATWHKSVLSGDGGCVEVAYAGGVIGFEITMEIYTQVTDQQTRDALKRLGESLG